MGLEGARVTCESHLRKSSTWLGFRVGVVVGLGLWLGSGVGVGVVLGESTLRKSLRLRAMASCLPGYRDRARKG